MTTNPSLQRQNLHQQAREQMRCGTFHSAVEILVRAYQDCGPHILVMVDLASCYYMLQDYVNFRQWTLRSYDEFNQIKNQLSQDSFQSSSLALGKLLE